MREDIGEIALAEQGPIPRLSSGRISKARSTTIPPGATATSGRRTSPEPCAELGLAYWGVTDHSKSSFQANGLDPERVRQQLEEIKQINQQLDQARDPFPPALRRRSRYSERRQTRFPR